MQVCEHVCVLVHAYISMTSLKRFLGELWALLLSLDCLNVLLMLTSGPGVPLYFLVVPVTELFKF